MFQLEKHNTTVKREVLAGITTFLTMVYIIILNPAILAQAGVPSDQVFIATFISTVVGTLWMGLSSKLSNRHCTRDGAECLLYILCCPGIKR